MSTTAYYKKMSPEYKLIEGVLSAADQYESQMRSERIKRGLKLSKSKKK